MGPRELLVLNFRAGYGRSVPAVFTCSPTKVLIFGNPRHRSSQVLRLSLTYTPRSVMQSRTKRTEVPGYGFKA